MNGESSEVSAPSQSLPYVDIEYEYPQMAELVDSLVQEEAKKRNGDLKEEEISLNFSSEILSEIIIIHFFHSLMHLLSSHHL